MKKLFTKIIKKNPVKGKKISLVLLVLSYFIFAFVALIKMPILGWITLLCGLLSIYLLYISSAEEIEQKKEEIIEKMPFFFSKAGENLNDEKED